MTRRPTRPARKPLACWLGFHELYFGGLPPMWRACRRCDYFR